MASFKKIALVSGLTIFGLWAVKSLLQTGNDVAQMVDKFDFEIINPRIKVSGTNVVLTIDIKILNPTKFSITVEKPYVEVFYTSMAGERIKLANSSPSTSMVTINAQTYSIISNLQFSISILSNLGVFKEILQRAISNISVSSFTDVLNIPGKISENLANVYPFLSVSLLTHWQDVAISKEFKLG